MRSNEQYSLILAKLEPSRAPRTIIESVMVRIQSTRLRNMRIHLIGYSLVCVSAFFATIPATIWLVNATKYSGFYQYLSLFVSDSSVAFANWKSLMLSMAESLPILETALVLGTILIFANMLRSIARTMVFQKSFTLRFNN